MASTLKNVLLVVPVLAGAAFAWATWSGGRGGDADRLANWSGRAFPSFRVEAPTGKIVPMGSLLEGGVSAVTIVDPACSHCLAELDFLDRRAAREGGPERPRVVAISVGDAAGTERLRAEYDRVPIYRDVDAELVSRFGLSFVPVLLVVDGGVVRTVTAGWTGETDLARLLNGQ